MSCSLARPASQTQSFCSSVLSAGIAGRQHHACLTKENLTNNPRFFVFLMKLFYIHCNFVLQKIMSTLSYLSWYFCNILRGFFMLLMVWTTYISLMYMLLHTIFFPFLNRIKSFEYIARGDELNCSKSTVYRFVFLILATLTSKKLYVIFFMITS